MTDTPATPPVPPAPPAPPPLSDADAKRLLQLRSVARGAKLPIVELFTYGLSGAGALSPQMRHMIEHAIHWLKPSPLADTEQLTRIKAHLVATGEIAA